MNLNILVRGQSNAIRMMESNGGAGAAALKQEVERLLGFDGVNNTVSLIYKADDQRAATTYGGTALIEHWLQPVNGDWRQGWTVAPREAALLTYVSELPAAQRDDPTAVLWFHSESDSTWYDITMEEWVSAVRFEAAQLRAAFGASASELAYLFVSAMPYEYDIYQPVHDDEATQAIRRGMELLAADPAFNAAIAARVLDIDADDDDRDFNPNTREYGGGHMDPEDALQAALRSARAIAESFAQYALPGSPIALGGGNIADEGPEVVRAVRVGANTLRLDVRHDGVQYLAALDADAAAGVGWSVRGSGDAAVTGISARIEDADTLVVTFSGPLPADGLLHYGWGYGRLAGTDGTGRGNAVYDVAGLPIWVRADGLGATQAQAAWRDMDADGFSDILWRHADGTLAVWEMNGIVFGGGGNVGFNPGLAWQVAGRGDFDADGRDDILWRGADGSVCVWEMNGTEIIGGGIVTLNPGNGWAIAGSGDFDADGRDDILWRGADGSVCVWEMDGAAIAGGGIAALNPGLAWTIAGTGDFNADGRADILWRGADGSICIWEMNGAQLAAGAILSNWAGLDWTIAGTGDFDGDGRSDILWRGADGSVAIWQMNGFAVVGGGMVALNPGTQWQIESTGDYDGNGRDEILWRDTAGNVVIWEMDGATMTGGGFLPLAPGQDWQIQL